ncbi:MAG: aminotransferase class V-fold PLP-dependent enzyme, partial [Candidatus Eisenbacteria bacterium]|nr:aminotransferase class V-fold PLP-dependent enzyme [Candidatus Eisenbacteria bacterium]
GAMSPAAHDPLLEWRPEFPTAEAALHFISHSLGAMPRAVEESLRQYALTWKSRGIRAWEERWMAVPTEVAGSVERILHAAPGSVSLHPNVTLAQALALSAIDFTPPRNRLVCTAEDFPSVLYLYEGLARRGAEIVTVPTRDGRRIEEHDVAAAIDERTAVVAISHVLFRTSQLLDLAPIVRRARAAGALTMIDAYQSVGTAPVDVAALDVDLLTGGGIKWLCGAAGSRTSGRSTSTRGRCAATRARGGS